MDFDIKPNAKQRARLEKAASLIMDQLDAFAFKWDIEDLARVGVSNVIHDYAPELFTGYVSTALIDPKTGYRVGKPTADHFINRRRAGLEIVQLYTDGQLDLATLINLLETKYCLVHWIASWQNSALASIQNAKGRWKEKQSDTWGWQKQYKEGGVDLVKDPGILNPKYLKPCRNRHSGQVYDDFLHAARLLNHPLDWLYTQYLMSKNNKRKKGAIEPV